MTVIYTFYPTFAPSKAYTSCQTIIMYSNKTINPIAQATTFRRFSRGGWCVFASLKRPVRIGVLTVAMLGSVCIEKVEAISIATTNDDEPLTASDEHELSEVTVAGTLAPLTQLQSARIVGVITRQQIEASAAQTVNDLLKLASGVDVRQRGGFGIQTDISIDGGTFDQITILLNGTNISNPHTGHLAADFPVSLSDIERIEILEGAASRVYGAAAFGGAINIVTKASPPTPLQGERGVYTFEGAAHGGSYATFGGEARVTLSKLTSPLPNRGGVGGGASLSTSYQRSDGAVPNSDFRRGNVYLRGEWRPTSEVAFDLQAGWSKKDYGANTFYSAAYPNQWEANDRYLVSIGATTRGRVRLRPEVYWQRSMDHFQLIRDTSTGENHHRTDVAGSHITLDFQWTAGHTAIGAEVRTEGIYSTNIGRPLLTSPKGEESGLYTHHDSRTNLSANLEHTLVLDRLTLSAGLLAFKSLNNHSKVTTPIHNREGQGGGSALYPGLDLAYRPAPGWKLFVSYNKGFRLPTFTDLYYKAPTHEGNVGLRAEESHSMQLGATYNLRTDKVAFDAKLRTFYHRGTHMIDWVMYSPDDVYHSANFDLDNIGLQTEASISPTPTGIGKGLVRRLSVAYTYIYQHRRDDISIWKSNYTMEYLRHKLVATLEHRIVSNLTAAWSLRWQDRMGAYILYEQGAATGQLVDYAPYAILDVKVRWARQHYELWFEGTNLTNHTYYDLGNVPQPGIVVLAGARLRF